MRTDDPMLADLLVCIRMSEFVPAAQRFVTVDLEDFESTDVTSAKAIPPSVHPGVLITPTSR